MSQQQKGTKWQPAGRHTRCPALDRDGPRTIDNEPALNGKPQAKDQFVGRANAS